jgi:D-glycero-D-manno-heptose 1,7-bisphosphate phosphatase
MKRAVFIERDTLLNLAHQGGQQKTPTTLEEFILNDSALHALQRLKAAGFLLIVTTNQPEISRGTLSRREMDRMHEVLSATLPIDDIMVCPHDEEDDCPCRKPRAGLFHEAAFKHHLALGQSFVISHRWQDAEAARLVGSTSLLIESPWLGRGHRDFMVRDLEAAADKVLERDRLLRKVA